ncbi:DUF3997 domain-containing protein [Winogradskyella poriferorum]|uniref:DUF3997 domain-containing protein n=1 Tax=Winogradskyella poriferorum TaxID=307627 RepID=UPI003D65F632
MKTHKLKFILLFFLFQSCVIFDNDSDPIIGNYEVSWIDSPRTRAICEKYSATGSTVLVPQYVFAIGYNSEFIIAKQHPTSDFKEGYKIDVSVTNYFIIDIRNGTHVIGPLNKKSFFEQKSKLDIDELKFTRVYSENL